MALGLMVFGLIWAALHAIESPPDVTGRDMGLFIAVIGAIGLLL